MKLLIQYLLKLLLEKKSRKNKNSKKRNIKDEKMIWNGPIHTSTPPNFKIYPLNKFEDRFSNDSDDDFKIYDDLDPKSFSTESDSNDSMEERIYENLVNLVKDEDDQEENVFENVIFLSSLELENISSEDIYEMILCHPITNHETAKWKFKPRTLKYRS